MKNCIHFVTIIQIDEVIGQAQATRSALGSQRVLFGDVQGKVKHLGDRFPEIRGLIGIQASSISRFYHPHTCLSYWLFNSLVLAGAIRRKRSKDTLILSAVIAACTLFLVIYWLSKWTCWEYDRQRSSNCAWNKWRGSGIDMHCMVNQYQVGNSVYKKMIIDSLCFLFAYLMKFSVSK